MILLSRLTATLGRAGASGARQLYRPYTSGVPGGPEPKSSGSWLLAALLGSGAVGCAAVASSQSWTGLEGAPLPGYAAEPKEQDMWDRWAQVKTFLGSWRSRKPEAVVSLPCDKLKCHVPAGGYSEERYRPVVLVSCGSFNPPTYLHLRMLELAQQALTKAGFDVLGCYMSPVNDAYWKQSLAPGRHRVRMCQLAADSSDSIMVDAWEVEQRQYTRTLYVLQHIEAELARIFQAGQAPTSAEAPEQACPGVAPRVMLVCGADVLHSMADPAMWRQDLLEALLSRYGVVCISRQGSETAKVLDRPGTLLNAYRGSVAIVQDPVPNEVSSSRVRHELEQGHSVRYLLPDAVINHVYRHGLYGTAPHRPRLLRMGNKLSRRYTGKPLYVMDPQLGLLVNAEDLATPYDMEDFDFCSSD